MRLITTLRIRVARRHINLIQYQRRRGAVIPWILRSSIAVSFRWRAHRPPTTRPASPSKVSLILQQSVCKPIFREEELLLTCRPDYQHRTKSSISPPFNFQHITHTAKKHLPRLETVDEKDLTAKFWAQHAYQRPKEKLVGIKANDLKQGQNLNSDLPDSRSDDVKQTRQVSSASQLIVSQGVTSGQGETAFDETKNAKIDSNDTPAASTKIRGEDAEPERPTPKRHSSSPEIHLLAQPGLTQQLSETISAQQSYLPTGSTKTCRASMPVAPMSTADNFLNRVPVGARYREHQPLPALPKDSKSTSKSPGSSRSSVTYSLFPTPPASNFDHLAYLKAKRSSVSGGTSTTGRSHSSSSWKTDVLNETTWEEDIDYAYEQEAEAECDFDWESTAPGGEETSQISTGPSPDPGSGTSSQGGGVRLSAWVEQPSALASTVSDGTTRSGSVDPGSPNDTHTHKRGSSVGHKGFLAARSASENTLTKSPAVSLEMGAATGKIPAPKLSLTEADLGPSSPCVPHNSSTVHIPTFDAGPEYLSDPESMPSSKHRKSSSYGSFDSAGHSLQRASDTTRWSSASTGSIPDLMHAKRKSKRSSARPLESVPHSPKAEEQDEDSLTVPSRAPHWDRERDPITMRRPATPGDRQILFSAGRHVQKGRNSAPTRINRNSPSASQEEVQTWI